MSTLGDKVRAKLAAKFPKFQVDAVVTEVAGAIDTTDGSTDPATGATHACKSSPAADYKTNQIDGDRIQFGDVSIVLQGPAVIGFTPEPGWTIRVSGITYTIVAVAAPKPDDEVAAFILQCRV